MAQNWRTLNIQICSRKNHSGNAVFNIKTSLATPGLQAKDRAGSEQKNIYYFLLRNPSAPHFPCSWEIAFG